ncbi:signal peptidase SipW [Geomicrobium sp. JCM 19037]|uniref:signal peptidase I SipW n=1 Tax=unclassified Geomicrobium TaxID=2628951 RepID=UPI00045F435E|nr:signal peptidase SipW [Geomicrobium sp. JCM 19037]GAK12957.1 signal peptidase SipW [Geomicrobium sp. JCM 19039]
MLARIGKWTSSLITGMMFVLLLATLFTVITSHASEGEPSLFGYEIKTVLSGSMEPGIQTGSIIAIEQQEITTNFNRGDVVTFFGPEGVLVTHRVHEVIDNGQSYITKGDNNNAPDTSPVMAEDIVGKYTGFTVPFIGSVIMFATSELGAVLLLIVPGVLCVIYSIIIIFKALDQVDQMAKGNADVTPSVSTSEHETLHK